MSAAAFNTGFSRNAVLDALLAKFESVMPWVTVSRKFLHWDQVNQAMRPALIIVKDAEDHVQGDESKPPLVTMEVTVFIYLWSPPGTEVPDAQLEDLLDAFDKALAPSPLYGNKQTLGGLVSHCWREGKSRLVAGDLDGDGLAIIPIKILIPS